MSACGCPAEKIRATLDSASSLGFAEAALSHGVHVTTVYAWRRRFGGMSPAAIDRVRTLEQENNRLMNAVASLEQQLHQLRNPPPCRLVDSETSHGLKSSGN
jgi:transposase-like protein